ncbi:MAG: hypothetical protein MJZ16_13805, partial [Bacteroidales bacterium]|nr:hypothetical protein [Bacteroidales bacterium]
VEDGYAYPKGDKKRCLAPIIDNCDIVAYVHSNGVDDNGKEIPSSAYFVQTNRFFARSRYPHIVPMIEEFTMDNLVKPINDGIAKQAEFDGITTVDHSVQVEQNTTQEKSYDELMAELQECGESMASAGKYEQLQDIVASVLGQGKKAGELKKGQEQIIQVLISELRDALNS